MRVTNSMLVGNFMNNLNTNMNKMDKLQSQMATNRKYAHVSDDPVSVIYSMQARYKLNRLEQYQGMVSQAQSWEVQVEGGVMELNKVMVSAYEACIDASTDVKSPADKQNIAKYVGQMRDHVLMALNTTFGDKYAFAGYNTTGYVDGSGKEVPPFSADPVTGKLLFNGIALDTTDPAEQAVLAQLDQEVIQFDIGPGMAMPVNYNGIKLASVGGTDLYQIVNQLYQDCLNGEPAETIALNIPKLQEAQNHLLGIAAELGGRTNRLDLYEARYGQDELSYTTMLSNAEDGDQAEIIMRAKMAEAVYNAALSSGARIIQPTLMDFLR